MPSTTLTIDEVYGGGGNSGATYKNDYIVIHNVSGSEIDLSNYSVQYNSANGANPYGVTALSGSIAAGGYYLVQEAAGGGSATALTGPDATGTLNLSATAGKVALVNSTAALAAGATAGSQGVVDFVGYGTATTFETAVAPAPSNTMSITRAGGGNTDTDNNGADFTVTAPHPVNSSAPASPGGGADTTPPTLVSTSPAANAAGVAVAANLVLNFSEAVHAGGGAVTLTDTTDASRSVTFAASDPQVSINGSAVTINPTADLHADDGYRVSIDAAAFSDLANNAYAGSADALDFHTAPAPGALPTGTETTTYAITAAGTYQLAAGATLSQTGAAPAITASDTSTALTAIDIEGALNGAAGQRAIVETVPTGQLTVGAMGVIHAVDGDGFQFKQPLGGGGHADVTNLGSIVSATTITTPSATATTAPHGYALNFNAATGGAGVSDHTSGGVVVNGAAGSDTTALLESDSSDAVRLGANQTLTNYGVILGKGPVDDASSNNSLASPAASTASTYDNSRGIEINGFSHDTVDNFGRIEGAQHGVDAGDVADSDITVINEAGGVIIGHNGSGVGSDGAGAAAASAANTTVTNAGAIYGEYAPTYDRSGAATLDGDGDGVDIDGAATVTNAAGATIAGAGANEVLNGPGAGGFDSNGRANHSEGLSLGGGVVENHGLISGADYGITVNNDSNANRSGVADTTIVNEADGVIVGQNGYAIRLETKGADSLDTDTITNHGTITGGGAVPDPAGAATIEGGSADQNTVGTLNGVAYTAGEAGDARFVSGDGAAIQTGEGNDTLVNDGAITGTNGHAISLEGGDDTLTLYAEGHVSGAIDGGAGADTLTLTAHTASDAQTLTGVTNVETLHVQSGVWTVADAETYARGATIDAGASLQEGAGAATGGVTGAIVDNGALVVDRSDAVVLDATVTGAGTLAQIGAGVTTLSAAHAFASVALNAGVLDVAAAGGAGAGAITFGAAAATLHVETAAITAGDFANQLHGFAAGDTLDVAGLGAAATATLGAGNLLTVTDGAVTDTFHLDPTQSFAGKAFHVAADTSGTGVNVTLATAPDAPVVLFSDDFTGFTAAGFAPSATAACGQLDSNVFRVVGLSDNTNPAYGFIGPMGGDFGRGVINGAADPTTAGVYSPSANAALVLQPTGAELDSNGYIEAHIVNTSGAAANPPTLDFDWTYRNSGGRGADLQLSYSTDGATFTAVPGANFATPAAAASPVPAVFSTQHEHVDLTGVNLAAGGDLYLRWTELDSSAGGGSGNRDEVGIDNVLLTAAPSGPVNGTAFSISATDATKAEGDAGAVTPFTFTATRAGDATAAGDVSYAVTGSGAHPADAADFVGGVLPAGVLHFAAGATSAVITVDVAGDAATETNETFSVGLTNPTGGALVTGSAAVGTIQNDDTSLVPIYAIQGASQHSPFAGQQVTTQGVVTAIDTTGSKGFYIQAENGGDHDANTSDAIFVFTNAAPTIHIGDLVQVAGAVDDYQGAPGAALTPNNLPLTELDTSNAQVTFESAGHTIAPTIIGEGGLTPPTGAIAADGFATYDPTKYAADFYESLEGMLVTVKNAQAVDNTFSGETYVVPDNGADSAALNACGGVTITPGADAAHANYAPERIEVFSDTGVLAGGVPAYNQGDHLGDVTGVVSYYGGNYELVPTQAPSITTGQTAPADDTTTLHADATHLTVGAYNVDNLGPIGSTGNADDTATKYAALGHDIAVNLGGPAILGVEEVQDADGEGAGTDYSGTTVLTQLTGAITAAGGPNYQFVEVAPTANNANGGVPNGNIRSAFLYDASKVTLVAGSVRLIDDPAAPYDQAGGTFHNSREPLAADFTFNGQTVTVIDVHQYSRGGSDELYGQDQPPVISGDARRTAQADAVLHYVQGLEAANPGAKIVVEGDFNGFYFEKALTDLSQTDPTTGKPTLVNLVTTLPANERYSYNFEGDSEQLDNLLVTPNLAGGALFDDVHVNTGQLAHAATDPSGAGAASDHDPILAQLTLGAAPTLPGGGGGDTMPGGGGGGGTPGGGGKPGTVQTGGGSASVLQGGAGNDTLTAGASQDTLLGGDGDDRLAGGTGHAVLLGNMGEDLLTLSSGALASTLYGGQGNDTLDASTSTHANYLSGDLGDDLIRAGSGGDTAFGGDGADTLVSGAGRAVLFGNMGDDHIFIGAASQGATVFGGQGGDLIDGSASNAPNYISGDLGNDTILSGAGFETVLGGAGDDSIVGGTSAGAGSMQLLLGNQGNDHLSYAGAGGVELFGGQDSDTITLTATQAGQVRYAFGNLGTDTLTATGGADSLYGGQGDDVVSAANDTVGHNYLSGDLGDDVVTASKGGMDTLHGGHGADTITLTAHAAANGDSVIVGAGDSTAATASDESNVQHILGFTSGSDHILLAGHASLRVGAGGDLTTFNGGANASEAAAFAAAFTYAYGDGGANAAHIGATEYLAVQESYGGTTATYLFTADHHAIALVGTAAASLQSGDVLAG